MNAIQKFGACLILGLVLVSYSCKKDSNDPVGCNYATEVQDEVNAVSAASTAYGQDPTPANCQAFKTAYQNWLNALEDHIDCATISGQQAQLQAEIDQAQAELDNFQC